jgi:hypothetical protein
MAQDRVKIKVITVRRDLIDLANAGADELAALSEVLYQATAGSKTQATAGSKTQAVPAKRPPGSPDSIQSIGALFRGPYGPLLVPAVASTTTLDTILLRELLANTAIRPVVADTRMANRDGAQAAGLIVRAPFAIQAFDTTGYNVGFATEEQMSVVGLAVAGQQSGVALATALFGESHEFGLGGCAASGAYTSALFAIASALGRQAPPEAALDDACAEQSAKIKGALKKKGYGYVCLGPEPRTVIARALAQTRAAADFYLSGAAAALSAAAIGAALSGRSVGPPAIASALRTSTESLTDFISETQGPPPSVTAPLDLPQQLQRRQYLLDRLSQIFDIVPDGLRYRLSALNEIWHAGASDAYVAVLTGGRESARVADYLERLAIVSAKRISSMASALAMDKRMSHARLLVSVVEEKVGSKRMREIVSALGAVARGAPGGRLAEFTVSSVALSEPAQVLALLTKNERQLVEAEAKNRLAAYTAAAKNNCPHVRLVRKMNSAATAQSRAQFLEDLIRVYLEGVDKTARPAERWHVCRSCGQNAICPHQQERIALEARGAPYAEVRARLERFALRVGGSEAAYYCRICAEQLAAADVAGEESGRSAHALGRFGELGAGLRTRIWAIAINALQRVQFAVPTDERRFAGDAATALVPLVEGATEAAEPRRPARRPARRPRAEAALSEASDLRDEISPRTELLAALFVYAYILDALQGRAAPSTFANGRAGERVSATAERMLNVISTEMGGQIAQLEDVSAEYLRAQFTAAYRMVQTSGEPASAPDVAAEFAVMMMTVDPVYRYAATAARAVGDLPLESPKTSAASRQEFELVMGAPLTAVLARARAAAKLPALTGLFAGRPGLSIPTGTIYEFWLKEPQVSLYSAEGLYSWSSAEAEKQQAAVAAFYATGVTGGSNKKQARERSARERSAHERSAHERSAHAKNQARALTTGFVVHRPLNSPEMGAYYEAWSLLVKYTTQVYNETALASFEADLQRYRTAEDALQRERAYGHVRAEAASTVTTSQRFKPSSVEITQLYDENGLAHDWGKKATFYYAASKEAASEIELRGVEAVMKARTAGQLPEGAPLVDVGCAVCGLRHSALRTLDPAKTVAAVRANSELVSFFLFYETRCPMGGTHTPLKAGGACSACGIEPADLLSVRSASARAYYAKYAEKFTAERILAATSSQKRASATASSLGPVGPPIDAAAWSYDYSIITDAAALAETTPAVIEAVGATAGREFADIVEGRGALPPPDTPADPRITVADATARAMFANYLALRRSPIATPALQELFTAAGVSAEDQAATLAALPDLGAEYCRQFAAVVAARTPADSLNFAIQSYCQFAVTLAAASPLGKVIAKNVLHNLVRSARRMSKPGVFDWAIFSGERELLEEEESAPDQVGDIGEDIEATGPEDETSDPFSGENIDYDTSENNPNNELE